MRWVPLIGTVLWVVDGVKPGNQLWSATPAELQALAAAGDEIALTSSLTVPACKLSGGDGSAQYVYGPELCPTASQTRCREAFGCRSHKHSGRRCASVDLQTLPDIVAMAVWVEVSGSRTSPECTFVAAGSLKLPGKEAKLMFNVEGVIYWSIGVADILGVTEDVQATSSAAVRLAFTDVGKTVLDKLLNDKCGANVACSAQCRAVLAQGYSNTARAASDVMQLATPSQSSPPDDPPGDDNAPLCDPARVEAASPTAISQMYASLRAVLRRRSDQPPFKTHAEDALPHEARASGWLYWLAEVHLDKALPAQTTQRYEKEVRAAVAVLLQTVAGDGEEAVRAFVMRLLRDVEGADVTVIRLTKQEADEVHEAYADLCDRIRCDNQLPQRKFIAVGEAHETIMRRLSEPAQEVALVISGGGRWPLRFCRSWTESRKREEDRLNGVAEHIHRSEHCGGGDRTGAAISLDFLTRGPGDHSFLAMYENGILEAKPVPTAVVIRLQDPPASLIRVCDSPQAHDQQQAQLRSIVGHLLSGKVKRAAGGNYPRLQMQQLIGRVRYWCAPDRTRLPDYVDGAAAILTVMFGPCAFGYPDCPAGRPDGQPVTLGRAIGWDPSDESTAAVAPMMDAVANSPEAQLVKLILAVDPRVLDAVPAEHLGLMFYMDGTAVYKKTTLGKSPNSILFIMGSTNIDYLWHSRRFLRPIGQYGGKESRSDIACHTGFLAEDNWKLFEQLEEMNNLPLFDGRVALIRGISWLQDSKAAGQSQCRPDAICDEPIVPVKITQTDLHVDGATTIDLAGVQLSDLYTQAGGRDAAWLVEFAKQTKAQSDAVRNARSVAYARRYLPEVEARLNVTAGRFQARLTTHRPDATARSDWYQQLRAMELLPTTPAPSPMPGTPGDAVDTATLDNDQLWYVVSTDDHVALLGFAKSAKGWMQLKNAVASVVAPEHWDQPEGGDLRMSRCACLLILSGMHLVVDSPARFAIPAEDDPLTQQRQHLSLSARMAATQVLDGRCDASVGASMSSETCAGEQRICRQCIVDAFQYVYVPPSAESTSRSAVVHYARTVLQRAIAVTKTYRTNQLTEVKCRLTKFANKECGSKFLGSVTRKGALQYFQTQCSHYESSVDPRELRKASCEAIGCTYTPYDAGPPRVHQKCTGDADKTVSVAAIGQAARDIHAILALPALQPDLEQVVKTGRELIVRAKNHFETPADEVWEGKVADALAAVSAHEEAVSDDGATSPVALTFRQQVVEAEKFEKAVKTFTDDDLKVLTSIQGYHRCGVPWMTEFAWDQRALEDTDELHAALRCITGFLDKTCRVLTELGALPRYEDFCLRIANIEFSTRDAYPRAKQVYGDDLEAWLFGRLKGGSREEKEDEELNPCAADQVPEPYQEPYRALCTMHTFLYLLFKSGKPEEEFGVSHQTLVHAMDRTLDRFGELMWGMFPVLELHTSKGDKYSYSWMKRGCHYFYVLLPYTFRMRGVVGALSARAGESAQFDGVAALHECTPVKGSDPTSYMGCGVTKHFGRSFLWWEKDEARKAQRRGKKKFKKDAVWARRTLAALDDALDVPWPADLVSAFAKTGGDAGGSCGERDEANDGSDLQDPDDVRDNEQGTSSLTGDDEPPVDAADFDDAGDSDAIAGVEDGEDGDVE